MSFNTGTVFQHRMQNLFLLRNRVPPIFDPFWADVIFLMLGEGAGDGVQVNPTTGTITLDTISGFRQGLGNAPFLAGATVSASVVGMPFGSSWIRHPGGLTSNNFIGCVTPGLPFHPRIGIPYTWDGWFQVDSLADTVCLFGDDSNFGGAPWNQYCLVGVAGSVGWNIRTGIEFSGTSMAIVSAAGAVTPNVPFHVECYGDGFGNVGLAVNGIMTNSVCPASDRAGAALLLGCQNRYIGGFERVMTGYSKCFRITQAVRHTADFTPPDALALYGPP